MGKSQGLVVPVRTSDDNYFDNRRDNSHLRFFLQIMKASLIESVNQLTCCCVEQIAIQTPKKIDHLIWGS